MQESSCAGDVEASGEDGANLPNPELARAHRAQGIAARERRDHLGAIAHFEDARKLVADDVWNTFDIAQEYRKLGRDDDALAYYRAVLAIKPDSMDAYRCMGWLESGRKRHEAALAHFRAASALAPDHHSLHVDIAGELRALGHLDEAEAECRQALAREPGLANAYRTLGIIARERKDHLGAIAHFEGARKLVADDVWNTFDIAQEYRKLGRDDDALAYYRAVLEIEPDSMDAYRCMGWLESGRRRHEAALAHFRAASALAPDHHSLHVDIAGELRA
ncbi:tetratricopeptide repeat protein, partial [Rhizobium sp.]